MKCFSLTLFAVLFTFFADAQSSDPVSVVASPDIHRSAEFLNIEQPTLASINKSQHYADYKMSSSRAAESCRKYKKMQTAGIVLSAVGGGLLIGGATMIAVGVRDAANGTGTLNTVGLVAGGYVMVVTGVFTTGAGIPLAVIGSVKQKKYCRSASSSSLELHSGHNGTGLALNF